jgi:glycosyltransferase involved in cell wall biosynthesis
VKLYIHDGQRRKQAESGYGQISAGISQVLPKLGHAVSFEFSEDVDAVLYICPPGSIKLHGGAMPKASFTMHELEALPAAKSHWVETLNELDLVMTPTEWNGEVWRRAGVTTPISVVPLGIDPRTFHPPRGKRFTILSVHENLGGDSSREDWRDTLRAYYTAFTGADPVVWAIKTWKAKPERFEDVRREVAEELGAADQDAGLPEIRVIQDNLSAAQMRRLYWRSWLFVKNANREGWSLPSTEALACGCRIAATDIEPLRSHLPEGTLWFRRGDWGALAQLLALEYRAYREEDARIRMYTWRRTAELVGRGLEELIHPR